MLPAPGRFVKRHTCDPPFRGAIGTPDYATVGWRTIEPLYGMLIPGGYKDEHITHYTRRSLTEVLTRHGFVHEDTAYIMRSEVVMRFRKGEAAAPAAEQAAPETGPAGAA